MTGTILQSTACRSLKPYCNKTFKFLTEFFEEGKGYSALTVARSSISKLSLGSVTIGSHPRICKCMRGAFNHRPSLPKKVTRDADKVVDFLEKYGPAKYLSLPQLTSKVTMLSLRLSEQRGHRICLLDTRNLSVSQNEFRYRMEDLLITSNSKSHRREIVLSGYPPDWRLCVVTYVEARLELTARLRKDQTKLLLSFRAPHKSVSRDTIRRWTKTVLERTGIDLISFTPHSTRAASTSKVARKIPLKALLQAAAS